MLTRDRLPIARSVLAVNRPGPPPDTAAAWLQGRLAGPMPRGAIALHVPTAVFQAPGGGENQVILTARHLEQLGHVVRPFCGWTDRLADARLLHLFGMSREGLELARVARARSVPVALSPISWVDPRAIAALTPGVAARVGGLAAWTARRCLRARFGWRTELVRLASILLPNSHAEARQLTQLFGASPHRIAVIPNAVERRFQDARALLFQECYGPAPFVLYVGRIEPRKNVLGLVQAVVSRGLGLVVIGTGVPGHAAYEAACHRRGGDSVRWFDPVDHGDPWLASAYAAARVFALPSWFETPGLAALEAALAGCAVVITPRGSAREYFGARALYARPDRPSEIARAIEKAWEDGPAPDLAPHIARHFLWTEAAQRTAEAYARITD